MLAEGGRRPERARRKKMTRVGSGSASWRMATLACYSRGPSFRGRDAQTTTAAGARLAQRREQAQSRGQAFALEGKKEGETTGVLSGHSATSLAAVGRCLAAI